MKTKNTLILLALTLGVGAFIVLWEKKQPNTQEAQRRAQNLLTFDREKVEGLVIQNGDDKIELRQRDKKWRLEAPIKDQADSSIMEGLIADLDSWEKATTIPEKEVEADKNKLAEYGLNKPRLRLKLIGKEMPPEIIFGKDAVFEGKMYVRFDNSKEAYVVSQTIKKAIEKKADDFRDRKLTDLTTNQVRRLVLKTGTGEMEFEKKGDHWEVLRPLRVRGDDQKIGDFIAQVTTAQIQQFVADDRGDLRPYGLAEPRGSITLFGEDDKSAGKADSPRTEPGQMLQIGGVPAQQKDQVYVRFAPRGFVYTLPKKIEELLNARPNDLRDRRLLHLDQNMVDRITIEGGGKKAQLARKDENWTIANRNNSPANASDVRRLLDNLSTEQVSRFVEDVASNLAKYGLDKPALQVALSSFQSENTPESKAGERPIASVAFGKVEGDSVYARIGDEPFVVAVRRAAIDNILADPLQWQDAPVFNFKPEEIHRISLTMDKESAIVRDDKNAWKWVNGSGPINQANAQSIANTLAKLHAARWAGSTAPEHGFAKPQLVAAFTTSADDKATHKLTVGGPAGNGMWFAKVDEREGTFILSNPDLNQLKVPLADASTPAPSPAGSPAPGTATSPVASPTATAK